MAIADPGAPWTVDEARAAGRACRSWVQVGADAGGLPGRGAVRARARPAPRARQAGARPAGESRPTRFRRRVRPCRAAPRDGAEGERGGARDARRRAKLSRSTECPSSCSHWGHRGRSWSPEASASGCRCGASPRPTPRVRATPSSPPTSGLAPRATVLSPPPGRRRRRRRGRSSWLRESVRPDVRGRRARSRDGHRARERRRRRPRAARHSHCRGSSRPRRTGRRSSRSSTGGRRSSSRGTQAPPGVRRAPGSR